MDSFYSSLYEYSLCDSVSWGSEYIVGGRVGWLVGLTYLDLVGSIWLVAVVLTLLLLVDGVVWSVRLGLVAVVRWVGSGLWL